MLGAASDCALAFAAPTFGMPGAQLNGNMPEMAAQVLTGFIKYVGSHDISEKYAVGCSGER